MTFYIFSMSHNIYVSNFYFTVDKETKSFGFPKMNLDVPQPHICSLKTTEYEVLPLISFKSVCGLRQALVPAIFRDDLDLLRVKAKGASEIIRSTFAFQGLMKYAGWVVRCAFRTREFSDVWTSYRMTTRNALSDENLEDRKLRLPLAPREAGGITQRNLTPKPFQENCLLKADSETRMPLASTQASAKFNSSRRHHQ